MDELETQLAAARATAANLLSALVATRKPPPGSQMRAAERLVHRVNVGRCPAALRQGDQPCPDLGSQAAALRVSHEAASACFVSWVSASPTP